MPPMKYEFKQGNKVIHTCYTKRNVESFKTLLEHFAITDYNIVETKLKY